MFDTSFFESILFFEIARASQSVSVYSYTTIQLHVNRVYGTLGDHERAKRSPSHGHPISHIFCFYEIMHCVSFYVLKEDDRHSIDALLLQSSFNIQWSKTLRQSHSLVIANTVNTVSIDLGFEQIFKV